MTIAIHPGGYDFASGKAIEGVLGCRRRYPVQVIVGPEIDKSGWGY